MSYYIEDQVTGLVDGYYSSKEIADGVAEGLNLMTREHLFLVKEGGERNNARINDCEFLGQHAWFLRMVSESME
jgi:hypothetical protein